MNKYEKLGERDIGKCMKLQRVKGELEKGKGKLANRK
jgi:hypothetical protein